METNASSDIKKITKIIKDVSLSNNEGEVLGNKSRGVYLTLYYYKYRNTMVLKFGYTKHYLNSLNSNATIYKSLHGYSYSLPSIVPLLFIKTKDEKGLEKLLIKKMKNLGIRIKIKDNKDNKMTKCIKICDASYNLFCNVSKIFKSLKIPSKNIYKSIYSIEDNQIQMKSPVREFVFENCEGNAEYEEDADDNLDHNDEQDDEQDLLYNKGARGAEALVDDEEYSDDEKDLDDLADFIVEDEEEEEESEEEEEVIKPQKRKKTSLANLLQLDDDDDDDVICISDSDDEQTNKGKVKRSKRY